LIHNFPFLGSKVEKYRTSENDGEGYRRARPSLKGTQSHDSLKALVQILAASGANGSVVIHQQNSVCSPWFGASLVLDYRQSWSILNSFLAPTASSQNDAIFLRSLFFSGVWVPARKEG
jgi:hypothetical protein